MNINKKIALNVTIVCSILATSIIVVGCKKENVYPSKDSSSNSNAEVLSSTSNARKANGLSYKGEEIFRGVFFMNGEFASEINTYKNVNIYAGASPAQYADELLNQNSIIETINKQDPNFFTYFEGEMKSGSCTRIDKALDKGVFVLINAMRQIPAYASLMKMVQGEPVINKAKSNQGLSPNYQQVLSDDLIAQNPDLLDNNPIAPNVVQGQAAALVARVVYFSVAIHNTYAATINVAAIANGAVYAAIVLWKAKWCWTSELVSYDNSDIPVYARKLNSLKYDHFVKDLCDINY